MRPSPAAKAMLGMRIGHLALACSRSVAAGRFVSTGLTAAPARRLHADLIRARALRGGRAAAVCVRGISDAPCRRRRLARTRGDAARTPDAPHRGGGTLGGAVRNAGPRGWTCGGAGFAPGARLDHHIPTRKEPAVRDRSAREPRLVRRARGRAHEIARVVESLIALGGAHDAHAATQKCEPDEGNADDRTFQPYLHEGLHGHSIRSVRAQEPSPRHRR